MITGSPLRPNEIATGFIDYTDVTLVFIGMIRTPWHPDHAETPRLGDQAGPLCTVEIFEPWQRALQGIEAFKTLEILYWLDRSRRDLLLQSPANDKQVHGTFSLRSPIRPNPIGTSIVKLERPQGHSLIVRGLDCFDCTPLLDIKPDRSIFKPIARRAEIAKRGDDPF